MDNSLSLKYSHSTFNSTDSLELLYIASACPDRDGNVVYQARGLYNTIYSYAETFVSNCEGVSNKSATISSELNTSVGDGILIFPNPNSGIFELYVEDSTINFLIINLKDISGKIVRIDKMSVVGHHIKMNYLTQPGIYYLDMLNPLTNESFTEKIIILK